jgi:hypothetical protein
LLLLLLLLLLLQDGPDKMAEDAKKHGEREERGEGRGRGEGAAITVSLPPFCTHT